MSNEVLHFDRWDIRGTDSNSLLRMYDLATGIFNKSKLQQERARADKAIRRIAKELEKRNVRFEKVVGKEGVVIASEASRRPLQP